MNYIAFIIGFLMFFYFRSLNKSVKGFIKFLKEDKPRKSNKPREIIVTNVVDNFEMLFKSLREVERELGVSRYTIKKCIDNKTQFEELTFKYK